MPFPTNVVTGSDVETGDDVNQIITLPSPIEAGNLIVVILSVDGSPTLTWPAGWNDIPNTAGNNSARFECHYRIATGSEGETTITVTSSTADKSSSRIHVISGFDPILTPEGASAPVTSAAPNPPSLTPSWGERDTLWLAAWGKDSGQGTITGAPSGYSDYGRAEEGTTGGTQTGSCWRQLRSATEDPAAFGTVFTSGRAFTIAIAGRLSLGRSQGLVL